MSLWLHEAAVSRKSGAYAVPQADEKVTQHERGVIFEDIDSDFFFTSHLWRLGLEDSLPRSLALETSCSDAVHFAARVLVWERDCVCAFVRSVAADGGLHAETQVRCGQSLHRCMRSVQ